MDIKELLAKCSCKLVGIQEGYRNIPSQVLFNTPIDGSTLCIDIDKISEATIRAKLIEYRKKIKGG